MIGYFWFISQKVIKRLYTGSRRVLLSVSSLPSESTFSIFRAGTATVSDPEIVVGSNRSGTCRG